MPFTRGYGQRIGMTMNDPQTPDVLAKTSSHLSNFNVSVVLSMKTVGRSAAVEHVIHINITSSFYVQ